MHANQQDMPGQPRSNNPPGNTHGVRSAMRGVCAAHAASGGILWMVEWRSFVVVCQPLRRPRPSQPGNLPKKKRKIAMKNRRPVRARCYVRCACFPGTCESKRSQPPPTQTLTDPRGGNSAPPRTPTTPPPPPPWGLRPTVSCQRCCLEVSMGAKGARRSMNTKGALRKILSTLHPNTILRANLDSNAHPQPSAYS